MPRGMGPPAPRDGVASEAVGPGRDRSARARFPAAEVAPAPGVEAKLALPDPDDRHVLAAAIAGGAEELLTLNVRDFPIRALGVHGVLRRHPDEFLLEAFHADPAAMGALVGEVHGRAVADGIDLGRRALLKKARLPRLGKAMEAA